MVKLTKEQMDFLIKKANTCECCGKEDLGILEKKYLRGLKRASACKECADSYFTSVKKQFEVEIYKGKPIYSKDGNFYPYWEAMYYYGNIDDCKARLDAPHIAII